MRVLLDRLGSQAWPVALLLMLIALVAIPTVHAWTAIHVALLAATFLFMWGAVRLATRIDIDARLRDKTRLLVAVGALVLLLGPVARIPWFLYTGWHRIENDTMVPEWTSPLAWWFTATILMATLMLGLWVGWSLLVLLARHPTRVARIMTGIVVVGLWSFALGFVVVQTDHTSEDILMLLPFGFALAALALSVLLGEQVTHRLAGRSSG